MWKPKTRDLELLVEHSFAQMTVAQAARALGVEEVELMVFLARLEKGRAYIEPEEPARYEPPSIPAAFPAVNR